MNKQNDKLQQLRVLKKSNDMSLQQFINEAYRILGNPIILYDLDWKLLAHAEGVITDDPFWNNHINTGIIEKNMAAYINEGFIDIMTRPDRVVLLSSEKVKYDRLFGKVYNKDELIIGGVSVVASNKPFEDDDFMITEAICKIFSNEICKIPYYQNLAQTKLETYINMLIENSVKDKIYATAYVEMIYKGLKDNLYVAVADISKCNPSHSKLTYYRDLFKQTRPAFKYSIYSNYIVIIMSTDEVNFYPKRCFHRLNRLFEQDNIYVGVSRRFENLFELPGRYNEAVKALSDGLARGSGERIFVHDDET